MPSHNNTGLSTGTVESVAGLSAGAVSTLVVHPLDLVKTRMQSTFGGPLDTATSNSIS